MIYLNVFFPMKTIYSHHKMEYNAWIKVYTLTSLRIREMNMNMLNSLLLHSNTLAQPAPLSFS